MPQSTIINSATAVSTESSAIKIKIPPTSLLDEDDSSLSSSGSDLFDHGFNRQLPGKERWDPDSSETWRRLGSSESATSTAISSASSSIIVVKPKPTHSSKKRLSDGTFKCFPTEPGAASSTLDQLTAGESLQTSSPARTSEQPSKEGLEKPQMAKSLVRKNTRKAAKPLSASQISSLLPTNIRPRSSIPNRVPAALFANQCIEAAQASRLNPFALHTGEHVILSNLLMSQEVTIYLNIRNAILRLWHQNPLCSVTPEEAAGCTKDARFFGLAEVAYKWLVRNGYINFGCVEVPSTLSSHPRLGKNSPQKTVVVIGAGVAGLTAARQLEGLFTQDAKHWTSKAERPPRVIVLEGRKRVGGRVYSKPFRDQEKGSLPNGLRNTVEMGAMIVTGFERGNPLNTVLRGQLGVHYHLMTDELTIYDCDGKPINQTRDLMNTELYTDISDRAGEFRALPHHPETLRGDEDLIKRHRDPAPNGFENFNLEPLFDPLNPTHKPSFKRGRRRNAPPGTEKLTGRSRIVEDSNAAQPASQVAKDMGWRLRGGVGHNQSVSLHRIATDSLHPSLGSVMDEAIGQYQDIINLTPLDLRLLNWHHANLEYANAAPVSLLSLSGHDQDTGNEFEGAHSEIIGGYTQLPRGLMNLPTELDVRFNHIVDSIHYDEQGRSKGRRASKIAFTNGEIIEADEIVITAPLGVLKSDMIDFDPPLPSWKSGAISRMGFGLLNKVVLLYDKPFWDCDRDMFGLLNEPVRQGSLDPQDYAQRRGRFYLIWNASKTSGRPALVALMAGRAAHDVEQTSTGTLLEEVNERLCRVFGRDTVPTPLEVIVTRWKRDPFSRGTYSYVAPETQSGDYDLMAKPVGNLHFAGEATCGTHPATVHGAFLSGLRVAAEVVESMTGAIDLPTPLVAPLMNHSQPSRSRLSLSTAPLQASPVSSSSGSRRSRNWGSKSSAASTSTNQRLDSSYVATPCSSNTALSTPVIKQEQTDNATSEQVFAESAAFSETQAFNNAPRYSVCAGDSSFWAQPMGRNVHDNRHEVAVVSKIVSEIGKRPLRPSRPGVNPFLIFTKDRWEECKSACSTGTTTAGRDVIRQTLGRWWKVMPEESKKPYRDQSQKAQDVADAARKAWEIAVKEWDENATRIRATHRYDHAASSSDASNPLTKEAAEEAGVSSRMTNMSNNVILDRS